jgi:hypothetical protein
MCTNCIINRQPNCGFQGWGKPCTKCQQGHRTKCTFGLTPNDRVESNALLAAALKSAPTGS